MSYKNFRVETTNHVSTVMINRAAKANSLDAESWSEMRSVFQDLDNDPNTRVIILSGEGKNFCAGIDLSLLMDIQKLNNIKCEGRKREELRAFIKKLQDDITSIEKCRKPVIAAIHGAAVGGGVDILSACDMRYCTAEAYFSIKEIDLGLVADIGTMQRLPHLINPGIMAEMAYTGRKVHGTEAEKIGLVNKCFESHESMMEYVQKIAETIATKSPLVVRGTKEILQYTRDHDVNESLNYMVAWNAGLLLSDDLMESFQAFMEKRKPIYQN